MAIFRHAHFSITVEGLLACVLESDPDALKRRTHRRPAGRFWSDHVLPSMSLEWTASIVPLLGPVDG
jgi:hypothetical protein